MIRNHRVRLAIAGAVLVLAAASAAAAEAVRPEVGKPLKAAEALLKSGHAKEALAKVGEADAVPNKTAYETFLVEELRGSAAHAAGELPTAVKSFETVVASGRVSGREKLTFEQAIAVDYYKEKDYAKAADWAQRYFKDGGTDPAMRTVLLQSYFLGNDCAAVARMVGGNGEEAGRKPSEEEFQILRSCYRKEKDDAGYVAATERLIAFYPKKEYWAELLARVQRKPGFADRLSVNVYRLKLATGNLSGADDYMEFAQLALQAGIPAEAKSVMERGYDSGTLGRGDQAARQGRLRDLVAKSLADSQRTRAQDEQAALATRSGDDLVRIGLEEVYEGHGDKGLSFIQQGIHKGGLRHPEDAKLALGEAEIHAGHRTRAAQTLRTVHGNDGTADLARLWILQARS
ncbi:MAG TPA: hypothetical protein VEG27_09515 [Usitatibacter sp.]|nr:hypothetical protein [Usitatibacter sp.]